MPGIIPLIMEFPVYFWFELIALFASLFLVRKLRYSILVYFVPFLLLIVLYEFGTLRGWFTINRSNLWAVNIITTIEFLFYGIFLTALIKKSKYKKAAKGSIIAVLILTILNILFFQGFSKLHSYTFLCGSILIIGLACYFFYELLDYDIQHDSILKYSFFWLITGVLFFYIGQFAFFCFFEYMIHSQDSKYRTLFDNISTYSNAILYSCIIIAFLCRVKEVPK